MDKYEYNVKLEQIKKLIRKKDYATAARIADTIDWYKVKNNQTIVLIADVYEASGRYEQARENLKLAYDRSGLGRQIAYKLVKVCIKCGKIDEAEDFYDDFVSAAPRDISKYLLQYELAKAKGEPLEKQISILEQYLEEDMDDRWAFELAKLYHKTGQRDKCIEQCDTVMLWFSDGKYVDKAMDLKMIYTPLTKSQQQRYEARWREKSAQNNIKIEEIKVKEVDVANKYNTQNIQNALKESMDQIFAKEEKAKDEAAELFKPLQKKEPEEPDDYSEADGAAEDADDYIARMALNAMTYENQRKQGMAAVADDEFEEEEEKDDLGDTKIFVTTRSKKNLGDTKVFDPRKLVIPEQVSFEREEQPVKEEKKSEPEEAYIVEEKTIKREEIKEELPEEEPEIEETVEEPVEEEAVEEQPAEETVEEAVEETAETVEEPVEEEAVEEQPAEETVEEAVEETAETVEEPVEEVVEEPVEEIVEEQSVEEEHAEEEVAEKEEIPEEEPEDSTKETVVEVEPGVMEQLMEGLFSDDLFAAATTEPEVKEEPETEEAEETVEEPEIVEAEEAVEEPEIEKAEEAAEEPEIEEVEEAAEEPEIEEVEEAAEEPEIEEVEDEPELEESFDGQYSFGFEEPEEDIEEEQIEGQMSLDDFFNEEGEYHVPEVDEEDDIETEPELDEEEPAVELDEVDEPEEAEVVEEEYDEADEPEVIEEEYDEPDELEIIEEEYDEAVEPEIIGEEAVQDEAEEPEEVREAAVTEEEDEETEENEEIDPFETVTELKIDKNLIKHSSDFEEDSEEPDETDEDGEIEESGEEEPEDDEDEQEDQESEDDEDEKEPLSNQEIKQIIKDFIGKYSGVQGLDKQMLRTLQNVIVDDNCNIFIMGDAKSGKTSLGIDIIKVVNKIKRNNNRRIAKISADKLIGKEMAVYFDKLKGSDLFIENISLMDDDTLEDLLDAIDNDRDSRIIVIEDEKVNADKLLERHGELRDYFANRIVVKQNKIKDWVAIAQEYAEEKGYEIDEIGLLALHAKIDQLYGVTLVIQRNHVENVIDNAIKKAEKGGLFKKFFGRKKDKVLTEEHFN
ncbi:MAG: tetratricopeptide repeat protein [Candidatus Gastranaerophilaceae bacterium]